MLYRDANVDSEPKNLPSGRLSRLSNLARVGLRSGATLLMSRDADAAAQHAAEVLGRLRGLAAKVGQMASYIDGFLPESQRQSYEVALGALRAAAPHSSPDAIVNTVEEELGAPMARLFADWQRDPVASASIGQVHRARLFDGREVAVKVQHPGIERAIDADLGNAAVLESVASMFGPKALDTRRMFLEVAQRVREELDYTLEAQRQSQFARIHACDPAIRIPAVIGDRSARRVLTSEFVRGESLEWAAEQAPELRRQYAETLWRFVFRGNLVGGLFNADPHPGNYMFQPDGGIAFLDFGCVQPIGIERLRAARKLHVAARRGDEAGFRAQAISILGTRGGSYEQAALAHARNSMEPLFTSPFLMTRAFVAEMVQNVMALKQQLYAKDKSFVPMPQGLLFMNRLQFGFYSVLARLNIAANYREAEEQLCRQADLPGLTVDSLV